MKTPAAEKIRLTKTGGSARRAALAGTAALSCLLLPDRGLALDPARDMLQYNCQTWTRQNGLPANGINAITQTKDGYLWLGTQSGMVRFDGVQFSSLNLPEGSQFPIQLVSSLASSRTGGLWFGLTDGSFGFRDEQGAFSRPDDAKWLDPRTNVISLCEGSDGSLWVGAGFVARYVKGNPGASFLYDRLHTVRWIGEDAQKRVWLVTAGYGLHYWQEGKFIAFPDDSLKQQLSTAAVVDLQGQIWVGSTTGLRCYDSSFRRKEIPPFTKDVRILLVDQHGVVWIGTTNDGLACYKNGAFSFLRQRDGLANNFVTSLFEDREGSLWVGTREGLSQLTDVKFPIYSAAQGLPGGLCHGVSASVNGGLWISTSLGVSYFDGIKATNTTMEEGLSDSYIKRTFEAKNGDVYLINGKLRIDVLSRGKVVATFPNDNWPTAFAEDSHGVVVAVAGALFRVSRAGMVPYELKERSVPQLTWIRDLLTSRDGALWVASVDGILRIKDGAIRQWTTADGLSDHDAFGLCEDSEGAIWAGLKTGIARIKGDQIRNISRRDGLLDDSIYAIVPDDHDHFWLNSSQGIFRVSRQQLNAFADGKLGRVESVAYNGQNVVKTIDTAEVEFMGCKTTDGRIWFPTPLGAVAIDPAHIPVNPIAPPVRIERVRANSQELTAHGRQMVPPGPGELEIHFTAPSFVAPQKVRFRYRLEGYDHDWVETENRRQAFYTNLQPDRYTFRVTAANADGVWDQTGDAVEIELRPHFYQATWFYFLCGGLGLGTLTGIYRWRIRHLKRQERLLQQNRLLLEKEVRHRTAELQSEITVRKRVEEELRAARDDLERRVEERTRALAREQARFKFIFESVPVGISLLAPNEEETHLVNPAHERITGVSAEESLIPGAFARASHPDDYLRQKVFTQQFLNGEIDHYSLEKRYLHRDGRTVWALLTSRMFTDSRTGKKLAVTTLVDITERRRAVDAVQKLNLELEQRVAERTAQLEAKNTELESFSYSVSHDLRAPLRSMDGFSRTLLEDYADKLDEEGKDNLRRIRAASQRMGLLIEDLLNLARVSGEDMDCVPVDLSALARTVAKRLQGEDPGRLMKFKIEPNLVANGDPRLLQIVLENLLGNASKFSRLQPVAQIEFGRTVREDASTYFVRDNGAGFDMNCAKKLFGAFQRFHTAAEFPGTGIGLATVQRIIHRHGGLVAAESQLEHGATFYFTLPDHLPASS